MGGSLPEQRLSRTHLLVLRLAALGADEDLIAECVGVESEAVGPLLEVARAKAVNAGLRELAEGPPIDVRRSSNSPTPSNVPGGEPQP